MDLHIASFILGGICGLAGAFMIAAPVMRLVLQKEDEEQNADE